MNASMVLMTTAWIAGADVVPAGCAGCAAPAPVAVAAPAGDCGCVGADPCPCESSGKAGLFSRLKGMFGGMGGKHHKAAECDTCAPAPACDGCAAAPSASAPAVVYPAPTSMPAAPAVMPATPAPAAMPAAPVANPEPKEMPKPAAPAPVTDDPNTGVQAPKKDDGLFAIPAVPAIVNPVSVAPKVPTLGTPANPF